MTVIMYNVKDSVILSHISKDNTMKFLTTMTWCQAENINTDHRHKLRLYHSDVFSC